MSYWVAIYDRRQEDGFRLWKTLGLGTHDQSEVGSDTTILKARIIAALQRDIKTLPPSRLVRLTRRPRLELQRLHLHLTVGGTAWVGLFPVILEEVSDGLGGTCTLGYHPDLTGTFTLAADRPLAPQYRVFLEDRLGRLREAGDEPELDEYTSDRKDRLRLVPFFATIPSLLERLAPKKTPFDDLVSPADRERDTEAELPKVSTCLSQRASESLVRGLGHLPREPYETLIASLAERGSVVVIGPPGCGKTTLIQGWVRRRLLDDGYLAHRSLESIRRIYELVGRRVLAGMKHFGEWEARAARIIAELTAERGALVVPDLAQWARLGRSRDSDRNLAEVFRGPLERGEVVIVGETTPESWSILEEEAPAFCQRFQILRLPPTTRDETLQILVHRQRLIETEDTSFSDEALDACIDGSTFVFPDRADPGRSLALFLAVVEEEDYVGDYEVASTMAARSGVPLGLLASWGDQSTHEMLASQLFGQPHAVAAARDLLDQIQSRLTDPERPFGVFLLSGPTGTGKTELAKAIAHTLYGSNERLLRLDMSELSSPDAPHRLLGSTLGPPTGLLTEPLIEQPFQVVLLDELEKAHPSVLFLLLQLLDDGRLTDVRGRTADFRRAVILMTTNLGAEHRRGSGFTNESQADHHRRTLSAIEAALPPELINRIDRILPFSPLSPDAARAIAHRQLTALMTRPGLRDRLALLEFSEALVDLIVAEGFDPSMGARTVKRWIESHIVDPLSERLASTDRRLVQSIRLAVAGRIPRITADPIPPHPETHYLPPLGEDPHLLEARLESARRQLSEHAPVSLTGVIDTDLADQLHFRELYKTRLLQARRRLLGLRADKRARPLDLEHTEREVHFLLSLYDLLQSAAPIHHTTVVLARPRAVRQNTLLLPALINHLKQTYDVEAGAYLSPAGLVASTKLPNDVSNVRAVALRLSGLGLVAALVPELGTHLLDAIGHPLEAVVITLSDRSPRDALADIPTAARPAEGTRRSGPERASDTANFETSVSQTFPPYVRRITFSPDHLRTRRPYRIEEPATATLVEGFATQLSDLIVERTHHQRGRRPLAALPTPGPSDERA